MAHATRYEQNGALLEESGFDFQIGSIDVR